MDISKAVEIFNDGGPVMWPISVLSVAAIAVFFERLFVFFSFFKNGRHYDDPQAELNRLQRGFGFISTVITAEPMLGILGTVTGIIRTFGALKMSESASPIAATAGIGEALVTTAAGIVAALVLVFPYNFLQGLLAKAVLRLERDEEKT